MGSNNMAIQINGKASIVHYVMMLCFIMLAVFSCPRAVAAVENGSEEVRVGYYENEVFQEGAQAGAVKTGYAYEYYQKLSEYTGWRYKYVYGNFSDLYQMLLDGKIDFLAGLAFKEERKSLICYPDSPMGNETYSLIKHDADEAITVDPMTLNAKRIGVLASAMADSLQEFLKKYGIQAEVVLFRDYEPLFEALTNMTTCSKALGVEVSTQHSLSVAVCTMLRRAASSSPTQSFLRLRNWSIKTNTAKTLSGILL